jgi:hypothetical protein
MTHDGDGDDDDDNDDDDDDDEIDLVKLISKPQADSKEGTTAAFLSALKNKRRFQRSFPRMRTSRE